MKPRILRDLRDFHAAMLVASWGFSACSGGNAEQASQDDSDMIADSAASDMPTEPPPPSAPSSTVPQLSELWGMELTRPEITVRSKSIDGFRRGINLGNRLDAPTEGAWGGVLRATDFEFVAAAGFDHVRLPVRFSAHALETPPFTLDETFMTERVDWAIELAQQHGLNLVLDLHHYDELYEDAAGHSDRFVAIWQQLATRYANAPEGLAFELLNEPNGSLSSSEWNELAAQAIAAIRLSDPERLLLVGPTDWNGTTALRSLELPDDENLAAVFHFYEPSLFTFQGKEWMPPEWATRGIIFPGPPEQDLTPAPATAAVPWASAWIADYNTLPLAENPSGPAAVFDRFEEVDAFIERTGLRLYNSEFTAQDGGDIVSRANWMRLVREECERRNIGWAVWEDSSGANLFNAATGEWNATLLAALRD